MKTDTVTLEILKSYFLAIAEGMGHTLERTAHTTFIKETADFATGIATPDGEFFCYPRNIGVTSFLGINMKTAIDSIEAYEPGDIIITNDPYTTSGLATHLPDIHLFKPLFSEGRLLCFAWCFIHCSDVGGLVPASISPSAYDVYQEGFRIPPRKLYRRGILDRDLLDLFLANCRIPAQNWGDMKAMVSSLNTAEIRMAEVVGKFGRDVISTAMLDILDWTEARVRTMIADIPDGEYAFSDYLDDDGAGTPIRLAVTLRVRDREIEVDYTGTDPQVNAAYNLPAFGDRHPFLVQGLINYMLSEDPYMPVTGGIMRPFRIIPPQGTVVNPAFPAAVGVRYATVIRLYTVLLGALAHAVPHKVPAAGAGQAAMVVLSVPDLDTGNRQVTVLEPFNGGGGATSQADGPAAVDSACGFLRNTPIENIEHHIPVLVERYDLVPNSAGPGTYRGGWGTRFDFRILLPESIVTARGMERCRFEPWGLAGGRASQRTRAFLNLGTADERDLGRIDILHLEPGDVVTLFGPGGGGYGNPLDREVASVATDILSGLLSESAARDHYGVVMRAGRVDTEATTTLRRERRRVEPLPPSAMELGPSRELYERVWSPDLSNSLAQLLLDLPPALRGYVKREIHRLIDAGEVGPTMTPTELTQLWMEVRQRVDQLSKRIPAGIGSFVRR